MNIINEMQKHIAGLQTIVAKMRLIQISEKCKELNKDNTSIKAFHLPELHENKVKQGHYECEMCHGTFEYGWTEEEARAEADTNGIDIDNCNIICDECYKNSLGDRNLETGNHNK